ncbi:MAG: ABC transporter permease subunit [Rhodospirillales bacterium]|nr:ABC transporter permease subunit [Rhodospirillales bacterium]MDE2575573.1 ABC transporter permease subunit [Rhodospirillales bacterium]
MSGLMPASLLPPPSAVPAAFGGEISGGFWLLAVGQSLHHYVIGVVLGSLLGVAAGVAVGQSAAVEAWQAGLARLLRPIPPLAWIPFALIWFGVSEAAAAFIIAISVFWLNYFATLAAVKQVDPGLLELGRAFGHGGLVARLVKIVLPAAAPGIFGGLRAGFGQGWMVVVASELFGIPGIGQRMMEASGMLATTIVVVYMLTIALLYGASDWLFQRLAARSLSWTA